MAGGGRGGGNGGGGVGYSGGGGMRGGVPAFDAGASRFSAGMREDEGRYAGPGMPAGGRYFFGRHFAGHAGSPGRDANSRSADVQRLLNSHAMASALRERAAVR